LAYDLTGRRTSMADGAGTTTYAYDGVGHLTESTRASRTLGYAYDHAGRLERVDYPASLGSVDLAYEDAGRLSTITDWDSRVTSLAYDPAGNLTELDRPGDLVSSYAYDDVNRPLSVTHAYEGEMFQLPDGSLVGRRVGSKSGGPTIDVLRKGQPAEKVHLP
jgi:YD repeat-containing protein